MAYEKQTWANGDIITAEKLNHMEDGIASNGVVFIELQYESFLQAPADLTISFNDIVSYITDNKMICAKAVLTDDDSAWYSFGLLKYASANEPEAEYAYYVAFTDPIGAVSEIKFGANTASANLEFFN